MMDLGFRAHDLGTFESREELAAFASVHRNPCCFHLAPYKALKSTTPNPMTEEWAAETRDIFARHNCRTAVLGCYINPALLDEEKLEAELRKFENGIDVATALGGAIVATETGSVDPRNIRHEDTWKEENFTRFLKNIERLLKRAEDKGVTIAVEAVAERNTLDTRERMLRCLETFRSPNLRCLFDAVNIMPVKGLDDFVSWYDETLDMLSPYIVAMHIKDYNWADKLEKYPYVEPPIKNGNIQAGTGFFPWKDIFPLYRKYNVMDVPMTMEMCRRDILDEGINYILTSAGEV